MDKKNDDNDDEVFTITKASDGNKTGEFKHFNNLHCPINNDAEASLSSGKPKTLNKEDLPQNSKNVSIPSPIVQCVLEFSGTYV